ncbi:MAG: leucyl-tRNA synthetase, partial [Patescibacteria group bacterium]|nr:leucyl-tRNA synthetase [Patescibacteria group bacterium]
QENINWCPSCLIGLANEEVIGGNCERCGSVVEKKEKEQWLLRITKYADRLIDDLAKVDFLEQIKTQQKNWIGRSDGAEINFSIKDSENKLKVFTTRPDTIFGVTFMVIAPEHPLIQDSADKIENLEEIKKYIVASRKKSDLERSDLSREKTGVEIKGLKAINPVNNEELPIFVADYVTVAYGTGAIMAVPAHDQRDWEFARKYKLEIRPVIEGGDLDKEAYPALNGVKMINCGQFTGLSVADFQIKIVNWLQKNKVGQATVNYRLHDWIFSRQRYWGEPIPMVYCTKCDWQPVAESDLPIVLPDVKDFKPGEEGQSPLAKLESWIKTTCPKCGGEARRETDTMPNWAGSNWYFIRYTDPKNNQQLADPEKIKHWLPVDWYNGGNEHTTLHLLYSRFVFKFLYDIGVIPKTVGDEPYKKRTAQGMILGSGGVKMSKSKGNVVNPDDYIKQYGADALRMYIMFLGPFDQSIAWDDKGVTGLVRFLNRVWDLQTRIVDEAELDSSTERLLHQSIKKIGDDIMSMHFNTAISQLMILMNAFDKQEQISRNIFEKIIILLSPFAPHISEELWEKLGHQDSITLATWPKFDQALLQNQLVTVGIQVNGKLRDTVELPADTEDSADLQAQICSREKVQNALNGAKVKKFIYIKNKIISLVA